ncbi:MAG TPA: DUF1566 domain-containing protein [Polyangiaceae bacterium]|nr:DUF1566 domain-containing protein [Polyangiaceae bacterium]
MELQRIVLSCSALLLGGILAACSGSDTAPANGSAGASGSAGAGESAGDAGLGESQTSSSAQWPMPNSPGLGLPNAQNYDASSTPGVVHDLVTELDWLQEPGIELYSRADAITRCDELSFAGFDDWRVPEFIELVSLFDVVPNDADPNHLLYISSAFKVEGRFWAASVVNSSGLGRLLDFTADGCGSATPCSLGVAAKAEDALGGAFCVRGGKPPASSTRYEKDGAAVTDLRTGLVWLSVPANLETGAYADALSECEALGDGARLPSINELLSILVPILDSRAFPNWPGNAFAWSSSTIPARPGAFWAGAISGATQAAGASDRNRIQCVR